MPLRRIDVIAPDTVRSRVAEIADEHGALDHWQGVKNRNGRRATQILVHIDRQQEMMDALQRALHKEKEWRIIVMPVEASLPRPAATEEEDNGKKIKIVRGTLTREELYSDIEKGAQLDNHFLLLVFLSAVVCAIGLIRDNVAVVIGAMVIAPLLGPNLALSFGAALGDKDLMGKAIKTNLAGISMTLALAVLGGFLFPLEINSHELLSRTDVGFDSIALALASGAAAVLSLVTGLSSTLVGVMVAVALMPPTVTLGLMIGAALWPGAYGAALLLAANIISVSLAAQLVFLWKGVKPRTWYMQKKSKQSVKVTVIFWAILLLAIITLIALRTS
ncbi:MAG: TIGR00341 family protein [Rhodospirillales bacterium]|nr:TIGR00341 family protein [Rhodospirillales bacterium]